MHIEEKKVTVREVFNGFKDDQEEGVVGYGGQLNIRPAYQREFVYKDKERDAVITTLKKEYPLNVMYWALNEDGTYELLDGQQRTISICRYLDNMFEHGGHLFAGLTSTERERILKYPLLVYVCEGNDEERLDWFETINIANKPLTAQELLNANYTGEWLVDAKKYFSKSNCPAYGSARAYLKGEMDRQAYLETALKWIADRDGTTICGYMAAHQQDTNASELWLYFDAVISWVKTIFPKYRSEMKGQDWGIFYNQYHEKKYDPKELEEWVTLLMQDEDVTNKRGIYQYLLSGDEKYLNIRAFSNAMKRAAYERQGGICCHCKKPFPIEGMEGDHIKPWHEGGPTSAENCQMLCRDCNRHKGGK